MTSNPTTAGEQSALWNGPGGRAWVELQELLDQVLQPFEDLLVAGISPDTTSALDVGCGTGSTTLALARGVGPRGSVTGVDVSQPMIELARERAHREASPASFVLADAQTHPFEPSRFDAIFSRFGVMFFEDPTRAFANIRRAAIDGANLRFVAWRSAEENPFMTTAERAAGSLLPELPARRADEPGQFAFADRDRVLRILKDSGWSSVDIAPIDVPCTMPEKDLTRYVSRLGPVGRVLQGADEATRTAVLERVRAAFQPYVRGPTVHFVGACWLATARA